MAARQATVILLVITQPRPLYISPCDLLPIISPIRPPGLSKFCEIGYVRRAHDRESVLTRRNLHDRSRGQYTTSHFSQCTAYFFSTLNIIISA
ncbi:hypothetical protein C8R44DRAFT_813825 [Mycena epipterygia]|nr:hypothetical protein C8R44DRAFT_813825 [Mycena epipterygia]